MLPYSMMLLAIGTIMTILWVVLGLPLGPGAVVEFSLQTPSSP
jgi:p-aminobenzoyl-glutamate transporter AbgT